MKKTQITIELMQNRQMLPIDEVDKKLKKFYDEIRKTVEILLKSNASQKDTNLRSIFNQSGVTSFDQAE